MKKSSTSERRQQQKGQMSLGRELQDFGATTEKALLLVFKLLITESLAPEAGLWKRIVAVR